MKEVEKNEIKRLSDRLDAIRHQQADLSLVEAADKYAELEKEKATLEAEIARLRDCFLRDCCNLAVAFCEIIDPVDQ